MAKQAAVIAFCGIDGCGKTSLQRINTRNECIDKNENYETLSKAKEGYDYLIDGMNSVVTIDANGTIEETTNQVKDAIGNQFKITL